MVYAALRPLLCPHTDDLIIINGDGGIKHLFDTFAEYI